MPRWLQRVAVAEREAKSTTSARGPSSRDELFAAAVACFLQGRGARWRAQAGIDPHQPVLEDAVNMLRSYLSAEHLGDVDGQCPMIALPSDVARGGPQVREAYQHLLQAMVSLFERSLHDDIADRRSTALALAASSVGGMVLARTLPGSELAKAVREAALAKGLGMIAHGTA